MPLSIAAFDFDETLTHRDTVVPFLRRVAGDRALALGLLARTHRLVPAVVRRDRNALRAVATEQVFRDRPIAEVDEHALAHGGGIVAHILHNRKPLAAAKRPANRRALTKIGGYAETAHRARGVSWSCEILAHDGLDEIVTPPALAGL